MILGASFGTAAIIMPYNDRMSLGYIDTGAYLAMIAGMMNHDVSWTGLCIHPYVQL
jgi:hypothetical protein